MMFKTCVRAFPWSLYTFLKKICALESHKPFVGTWTFSFDRLITATPFGGYCTTSLYCEGKALILSLFLLKTTLNCGASVFLWTRLSLKFNFLYTFLVRILSTGMTCDSKYPTGKPFAMRFVCGKSRKSQPYPKFGSKIELIEQTSGELLVSALGDEL